MTKIHSSVVDLIYTLCINGMTSLGFRHLLTTDVMTIQIEGSFLNQLFEAKL